jgi:tetratricopeptide (TPR) repeat protein
MKNGLLFTILLAFTACAVAPRAPDYGAKQPEYDKGLRALAAEDYAEAARVFDKLLVQKPGLELDLVTLFNSGSAYEGLGECQKASDRYRQVVRSSAGKFKSIEAQALFRLSLMYECLGEDAKTITALLDAKKRARDLPVETSDAEIPARIAAAYARLGNRDLALQYFEKASRGLKSALSQAPTERQTEMAARTLFLMGHLSLSQQKAEGDANSYLQSIIMQQPHLLRAIELNHDRWSAKAETDLKLAYDNIWKFRLEDENKQREFYTHALQTINELRKIHLPGGNARVEGIFAALDSHETKLQAELSNVSERNALTPDAERREGLKRDGKLVDPPAH